MPPVGRLRWARLGFLFVSLLAFNAYAQDLPPTVAEPEPLEPTTPADQTGGSVAEQQDAPTSDEMDEAAGETGSAESSPSDVPRERIIYVPFDQLDLKLGDSQSNILIPLAEYQKLLEAARAAASATGKASAVLTSAEWSIRANDDEARIHGVLTARVQGTGESAISFRLGNAAVGSVQSDEDVLLRGTGNGSYELLFRSPGTKRIELDLLLPVQQSPDGRSLNLEVPPVAMTTVDVRVSRADQTITIEPNVVISTVEEDAGDPAEGGDDAPVENGQPATHVRAQVGATSRLQISWRPRAGTQPQMDLLTNVTSRTMMQIAEGVVHTDTWLIYDILRGELSEVRVAVPLNHRILDVTANGQIGNWKVDREDNRQLLTLELLSPATGKLTVELHTEFDSSEGEIAVGGMPNGAGPGGIHPLDVVREVGQLAVRHAPDLEVQVLEQSGLMRIAEETLGEQLKGNSQLAYQFYSPDMLLRLSVSPVVPRVVADQQIVFELLERELRFRNVVNLSITRGGLFDFEFRVPDGVVIDAVDGGSREFTIDGDRLRIPLSRASRTTGTLTLVVTGHLPLEENVNELTLPVLEALNVSRETGSISLFARDSFEVRTQVDAVEGAQPMPLIPRIAREQQVLSPDLAYSTSWSFSRRPITIPLTVVRKPTRISADVGTTVNVQPELTEIKTQVNFLVEYAGVDTFRISVPESVSNRVRIEVPSGDSSSAPIQQSTPAEPQDGRVIWTVITQREARGRQQFVVTYDIPAVDNDQADASAGSDVEEARTQQIEFVRPLGLIDAQGEITTPITRLQGEVVVVKDETLAVGSEANVAGLEQIDVRELKTLRQSGTLAYRYFRDDAEQPVSISLSIRQFEIQEVVATVISRALTEVVLGEDHDATYRCRFQVKSSERQRLLAHLPANLQVLGVFLNDREIKLEPAEIPESLQRGESWKPYWINVARKESSVEPFLLAFQFLWRVNPSLGESQFGQGTLSLPLPVIGQGQEAVVQELRTVVWVPEEYALVGEPMGFQPYGDPWADWRLFRRSRETSTVQHENWISSGRGLPGGLSQFPAGGHVPYIFTNLGGASRIEVRWWNRIAMTLFLSGVLALIGWILLRTSWENKLGFLLLLGFLAALYGLKDPHGLREGLLAAGPGLILLLAIWLIHGLFRGVEGTRKLSRRSKNGPENCAVIPPPGVFDKLQPEPGKS